MNEILRIVIQEKKSCPTYKIECAFGSGKIRNLFIGQPAVLKMSLNESLKSRRLS